jgi:integrase
MPQQISLSRSRIARPLTILPDYLSRRWKALAKAAHVPAIKLYEGRHSAASLQRDAAIDREIRRRTLGHADQAMTSHDTHMEAATFRQAANAVAAHVDDEQRAAK